MSMSALIASGGTPSSPGTLPTFMFYFLFFFISSLVGLLVSISNVFSAGSSSAGPAGRLSSSPKCSALLFDWSLWFVSTVPFSSFTGLSATCGFPVSLLVKPYTSFIFLFPAASSASSACRAKLWMYPLLYFLMLFFTSFSNILSVAPKRTWGPLIFISEFKFLQ